MDQCFGELVAAVGGEVIAQADDSVDDRASGEVGGGVDGISSAFEFLPFFSFRSETLLNLPTAS